MRGRMQILTRTVTVITKPQHISNWDVSNVVVYHPYSSPNHNSPFCTGCYGKVVSHPYSSPNHNIRHTLISLCLLYLILIHHQTTTRCPHSLYSRCCISSLFITKPQPIFSVFVLLLCCISSLFITKPQHACGVLHLHVRCISSLFITKPQPHWRYCLHHLRCISSLFITKPQL